jgi:murein DD-endopeptidase MepM/ murein hydrolase activator NlpD
MKNYIKQLLVASFVVVNIFTTISAIAVNTVNPNNQKPIEVPIESSLDRSPKTKEGKTKVKVIKKLDGKREIDNEPGVKMTKSQENAYNECKKEVEKTRTIKYKNKPTPCSKIPIDLGEHTDQDYNVLWDKVNQNIEKLSGKDMSKEIPFEDYIKEAEIVPEEITNSSSSSYNSSNSTLITSSNSSSQDTLSSAINSSSSNSSIQSSSEISVTSSSKISILDTLFGSVKVSAAKEDGFRMPWTPGTTATLQQTPYNNDVGPPNWPVNTHASHWNVAAFDFVLADPEVKAAKEGQVVFAGTCNGCGFGWHVVVQSPDGSVSLYAHMSSYAPDYGNYVARGQKIGVQGNSGSIGGPVHLHFETFNRFPCNTNSIVEKCFEPTNSGYLGSNANQYYKDSTMLPKFDECYASSGLALTPGRCTNGYPTTLYQPLGSINTYITPPPATYSKIMFRRKNTNQCIDIDSPYDNKTVYTWECQSSNQNQKWEVIPKGNNEYQYRRLNTNQCLEAYNPQTEGRVYTWTCDNSAEQRFNYNWSTQNLFRVNALNNNQCVAKGSPSNGVQIKMYTCTAAPGNDNFKWDIIGAN